MNRKRERTRRTRNNNNPSLSYLICRKTMIHTDQTITNCIKKNENGIRRNFDDSSNFKGRDGLHLPTTRMKARGPRPVQGQGRGRGQEALDSAAVSILCVDFYCESILIRSIGLYAPPPTLYESKTKSPPRRSPSPPRSPPRPSSPPAPAPAKLDLNESADDAYMRRIRLSQQRAAAQQGERRM